MAAATYTGSTDLIFDLSQPQFMHTATVGALVRARVFPVGRSRSVVLGAPLRPPDGSFTCVA